MTGLPFVYAFWAGHEMGIKKDDIEFVKKSYEIGRTKIEEISRTYAKNNPLSWEDYQNYLAQNIRYEFGVDEKEGLMEFYRYAFYFGLIEHIPELHFYE
jgi:predicted solute-binding protein